MRCSSTVSATTSSDPKAGDPFVFPHQCISAQELGRLTGDYSDKYYIKRIGGVGGETLAIQDGAACWSTARRAMKSRPLARNAAKEGEYGGYINHTLYLPKAAP